MNDKILKMVEIMKSYEKTIMPFSYDDGTKFIPGHHNPKEDGFYLTIRCGLSGIYTMLNEWKDGAWQRRVADDSRTIAWQKNQELIDKIDKLWKMDF